MSVTSTNKRVDDLSKDELISIVLSYRPIIEKLEVDLNTARQMYCRTASYTTKKTPQEIADALDWDCYSKE